MNVFIVHQCCDLDEVDFETDWSDENAVDVEGLSYCNISLVGVAASFESAMQIVYKYADSVHMFAAPTHTCTHTYAKTAHAWIVAHEEYAPAMIAGGRVQVLRVYLINEVEVAE